MLIWFMVFISAHFYLCLRRFGKTYPIRLPGRWRSLIPGSSWNNVDGYRNLTLSWTTFSFKFIGKLNVKNCIALVSNETDRKECIFLWRNKHTSYLETWRDPCRAKIHSRPVSPLWRALATKRRDGTKQWRLTNGICQEIPFLIEQNEKAGQTISKKRIFKTNGMKK